MKNLFTVESKNYKPDKVALNKFKVYKTLFGAILELQPTQISIVTKRREVSENWYIESGSGKIWIKNEVQELIVNLSPGKSLIIPKELHHQIKNTSNIPLRIIAFGNDYSIKETEIVEGKGYWDRYENTDEYKEKVRKQLIKEKEEREAKRYEEYIRKQNSIAIPILEDEFKRALTSDEKNKAFDILVKYYHTLPKNQQQEIGNRLLKELSKKRRHLILH